MTYMTDIRHFLTESGGMADLPGPAARLARYLGAIIAAVSVHPPGRKVDLAIACRRRPGRKHCKGRIEALVDAQDFIQWACPVCGERGTIHGWRGTSWDQGTPSSPDSPGYDTGKVDELTLALLYLVVCEREEGLGARAWKGFDRDTLVRLHEKGLISDPMTSAKSVVMTDEGYQKARMLFYRHFGLGGKPG